MTTTPTHENDHPAPLSAGALRNRAKRIDLVALDVDGILTNGQLYFSAQGDTMKAFTTQDGLGIKMLQRSGIEVAIITGRHSEIVKKRAEELGITHLYQGSDLKLDKLKQLAQSLKLEPEQIAFMGDDLPDLPAMLYAGIGATVPNAVPIVKKLAHWESDRAGGEGAVREFAEFLLDAQNQLETIFAQYLSEQ